MSGIDYLILILVLLIPSLVMAYYFYDRVKADRTVVDQRSYIDGLIAALDGNDRKAFAHFRDVVAVDTNNIDAYLRIGDIFRRNGKPERALQIHQDLSIRHDLTPAQKAAVYRAITQDYLAQSDYPAAARSLEEFNKHSGGDAWSLSTLLTLLEKSGDWEKALATQEKLLKLKGELSRKPLARFKVMIGDRLAAGKQYHQARLAYKEALNLDDRASAAYLSIGDTYVAESRTEDAISMWKRMVSNVPEECGPALARLEKALFEVGRFGEIEDICHTALRLDPTNLEARLKLASYFTKKSEYEAAEEELLQALDNNPDSYKPALELARLYLKSKKEDKIHDLIGLLERKERESLTNAG
ncbi:MAG TPA: tetratricopeptide repeat protein [candidate division Zixibacteria bacterium]|nr:tetratricopeptide repeat protein [candidate division Zixibacteria bacterium]